MVKRSRDAVHRLVGSNDARPLHSSVRRSTTGESDRGPRDAILTASLSCGCWMKDSCIGWESIWYERNHAVVEPVDSITKPGSWLCRRRYLSHIGNHLDIVSPTRWSVAPRGTGRANYRGELRSICAIRTHC